jgi:hypothetical protein
MPLAGRMNSILLGRAAMGLKAEQKNHEQLEMRQDFLSHIDHIQTELDKT